jgi:hypothetical protein
MATILSELPTVTFLPRSSTIVMGAEELAAIEAVESHARAKPRRMANAATLPFVDTSRIFNLHLISLMGPFP